MYLHRIHTVTFLSFRAYNTDNQLIIHSKVVFVKTEKADAKYSYKQACGYFPGVVSTDGIIAYIENRDGNTPVKSTQFLEDSRYRIVVLRTKEKDSTPDLFGDRYTYRCIITNDWDSEEKNVIETYNKRGARERDFDRLNNDFGWKHLPCSFLNENTVYMILTAFCMNFFSYFIRAVSSVFTSLSPTSRVKKFVFHFTTVCAKWTRTARRWWLNLYTGMPYDKLSFG